MRLSLGAVAAALMVAVAAMTQAGFAGNLRYVALPAALVCVLAGAGWVDLVRDAGRALRRGRGASALAALLLAAARAVRRRRRRQARASTSTSCAPSPSSTTGCRRSSPSRAAPTRCCDCGPVYAPPFEVQAVAWAMHVHSYAGRDLRRAARARCSPGTSPRSATIRASRRSTRTAAGSSVATAAAGPPNLMRMATYASRPAWELRARAVSSARRRRAAGDRPAARRLRPAAHAPARRRASGSTRASRSGIADRPLGDIPGVLRQDGSPPLYYLLLNLWLARRRPLGGERARAVGACSRCSACRSRSGPGWSLFGRRTAWIAALLAAVNPFLTQYAQEGRMYALVALLGLVSLTCWLQAFTTRPAERRTGAPRARRSASRSRSPRCSTRTTGRCSSARRPGVAWLVLLWRARGDERARLLRTGLLAYGGVVLLYAPWIPNTLYQAAHTGAPWSKAPSLAALASVPARILGEVAEVARRSSRPARASSRCCARARPRAPARRRRAAR